jgi:hypothetical protein
MLLVSICLLVAGAVLLELETYNINKIDYHLRIIALILISLGASVAVLELL